MFICLIIVYGILTQTVSQDVNSQSEDKSEISDNTTHTISLRGVQNYNRIAEVTDSREHKALNRFTNFIQNVIYILNKLNDIHLKHFFTVLYNEITKFHYYGCKFNELADNNNITNDIIHKLDETKTMPAKNIREQLTTLFNMIKDENYDNNEKSLVDFFNSLYDNDFKFKHTFMELYNYERKAEKNNDLVNIVRNGLRSIIFDHYSQLNSNKRQEVKTKINEYWFNTTNVLRNLKSNEENEEDTTKRHNNLKINEEYEEDTTKRHKRNKKNKTVKGFTSTVLPRRHVRSTLLYYQEDTDQTVKRKLHTHSSKHRIPTHTSKHTTKLTTKEEYTFKQMYVEKNLDLKYDPYAYDNLTTYKIKSTSTKMSTTSKRHKSKKRKHRNKTQSRESYFFKSLEPSAVDDKDTSASKSNVERQSNIELQSNIKRKHTKRYVLRTKNNGTHTNITGERKHETHLKPAQGSERSRYLQETDLKRPEIKPSTSVTTHRHVNTYKTTDSLRESIKRDQEYTRDNFDTVNQSRDTSDSNQYNYSEDALINNRNLLNQVHKLENEMNLVKLEIDRENRIVKELQSKVIDSKRFNNYSFKIKEIKEVEDDYDVEVDKRPHVKQNNNKRDEYKENIQLNNKNIKRRRVLAFTNPNNHSDYDGQSERENIRLTTSKHNNNRLQNNKMNSKIPELALNVNKTNKNKRGINSNQKKYNRNKSIYISDSRRINDKPKNDTETVMGVTYVIETDVNDKNIHRNYVSDELKNDTVELQTDRTNQNDIEMTKTYSVTAGIKLIQVTQDVQSNASFRSQKQTLIPFEKYPENKYLSVNTSKSFKDRKNDSNIDKITIENLRAHNNATKKQNETNNGIDTIDLENEMFLNAFKNAQNTFNNTKTLLHTTEKLEIISKKVKDESQLLPKDLILKQIEERHYNIFGETKHKFMKSVEKIDDLINKTLNLYVTKEATYLPNRKFNTTVSKNV